MEEQEPSASNNYTWYRLYNDGWCEQGGYVAADSQVYGNYAITLPVEMASNDYNVSRLWDRSITGTTGFGWDFLSIGKTVETQAKTSTTLYCTMLSTTYSLGMWWQVAGKAAAPTYSKVQCIRY